MAPFGGVPTANHQANVYMYESLLAWDQDLNIVPALGNPTRRRTTRRTSSSSARA